jgi:probable HAF family extracellular repeat protein
MTPALAIDRPSRDRPHGRAPWLAAIVGASLTVVPCAAWAQASYRSFPGSLGDGRATDVSADGSVVVGESWGGSGIEAFRWTAATGSIGLGDLTADSSLNSEGSGVSADGAVVVGNAATGGLRRAFRWTAGGGMVDLGALDAECSSYGEGVSADGSVVAAIGYRAQGTSCGPAEASRWTAQDGMVGLIPDPGAAQYSFAHGISADGSTIVGEWYPFAFRWTPSGGVETLPMLQDAVHCTARAASADGSVIVGECDSSSGSRAFRWTESHGIAALDGAFLARDVSADGAIVVGEMTASGSQVAFVWSAEQGVRDLRTVLIDAGVDMTGWWLPYALAVSGDGRAVVGQGHTARGGFGHDEPYVALLPATRCRDGVDNDGDGQTDHPADPGCAGPNADTEDPHCGNAADDDGDGLVDLDDPGCFDATDPFETAIELVCDDGRDDDGDGLADLADPGCAGLLDDSEKSAALQCDNGEDDDDDGVVDFPADRGCSAPADLLELGACQNGVDDDGDGFVDFPEDPGCDDPTDGDEAHLPKCSNGEDDDGDTLADFPADAGCASADDEDESDSLLACDDAVDEDSDSRSDYPWDPGCESQTDDSERSPTLLCDNGSDDDGDGAADFPFDTSCLAPSGFEVSACSNGRDDDRDGLVDYPLDPDCWWWPDGSEAPVVRWNESAGGNGHAYELVHETLSWTDARAAAASRTPPGGYLPGQLLTISEAAENAFVWSSFAEAGWMGFSDEAVEGEWRWIDDTPGIWQDPAVFASPVQTAYVRWAPDEPNDEGDEGGSGEDFGQFAWFDERWNDGTADVGNMSTYYVEYEPVGPVCDNGFDDDGDGRADFPADPDCSSPSDVTEEFVPACSNGEDDDGDGLVDFPEDPGCPTALAFPENPPCDDDADNDGDGQVDSADPECQPSWPYWERPPRCGLGAELALVLAWMKLARRGTRAPS